MPRSPEQVKRICYADDITVWALGVNIPELEHKVNNYLTGLSRFLRVNSLLISAPMASVTLFTPHPAQANTRPKIKIDDSQLPLVCSPKLLGVYLDTLFSFNTQCIQVANRKSQQKKQRLEDIGRHQLGTKKTLLMTYKVLGRSTVNYTTPIWSTNAIESNIGEI